MKLLTALAALSGAIAVGAGAFGAHGASASAADLLKTGGHYQLVHAVAALAAIHLGARGPAALFVAGGGVFAFSLYLLAVGASRWVGAITPLGGLMLIIAWLWLAWRAISHSNRSAAE